MGEPREFRSEAARDAVVHPLTRAAERPCARPGCPAPARATLTFAYGTREAVLDRLSEVVDPQGYDLCVTHAQRTDPPRGWSLTDRRPDDERDPGLAATAPDRDLGGSTTVAVLAAALRAVPDRREPTPRDADEASAGSLLAGVSAADHSLTAVGPTLEPDPSPVTVRGEEPTVELPHVRTPRPIPAVEQRQDRTHGPATDW